MSPGRKTSVGTYAREITRLWSEMLERPVILSRKEWSLIGEWYAGGIPLDVIREAIGDPADSAGRGARAARSKPRSLSYIAPAVEEIWTVVRQGRLPSSVASDPEPETAELSPWRRRMSLEPAGSALGDLLGELLERLEAGDSADEIERCLEARLLQAADGRIVGELERSLTEDLETYRERMPEQAYAATYRKALIERLRRRLELSPLAGNGQQK